MFIMYFHSGTVGAAGGGLAGRKKWLYIPINVNAPCAATLPKENSKATSAPSAG